LDEWVGVELDNEGSCHYFLHNTIFIPLEIEATQIHVFDAMANDIEQVCKKMDSIIESKGGIDLMLVGIGMNGHIGFNEPGVSFANYSHVINLDETTLTVGQKYFSTATNISKGITLGLQHLMESQKVILIANGEKKATIIKKMIEENITNQIPSTIMQQHSNGYIFLDEAAATQLKK
jgi:glucosamine-6-phosphate isomerase